MKRFSGAAVLLGFCLVFWGCESDLDKANALAKAGKKDLAVEMYKKVLKADKKSVKAREGLAEIHCGIGSFNALSCLVNAKELRTLKSKNPKLTGWLKRSLYQNAYDLTTSGSLTKAEEYLNQYLALDAENAKAHFIGALIKKRFGTKSKDSSELREAITRLNKVLKLASKTDTMKLDPKAASPTPLKWEAAKMQGNLYEGIIINAMSKFEKSPAGKKKGATFKPNDADFQGAVKAYEMAHSLSSTQPKKSIRFFPLYQVAMLHVNFKNDTGKALEVLKKADAAFPKTRNVLMGIYQVYKKKAEGLKGRRNRRKKKKMLALASKYLAMAANAPKPRAKPKARKK